MHLANRPTIPEIVPPSGLRLVAPLPMAAERIRQRARHPVQAVPLAVDGEATLSERDEREQQAIADQVEGILP